MRHGAITRRHFAVGALAGLLVGCGASASAGATPARAGAGPGALAADLAAIREEEKFARDTYRVLGARWPLPAFEHIAEAEQRHFELVGGLLERRGLADPVRDDAVGVFTDPRFEALHAELVGRGARSEVDALEVGAFIEELDIADLDAVLSRTSEPDARRVYELLRCGSRNHLRAFDALLEARGANYAPTQLSPERYREIATGEHERCGWAHWGERGGRGVGRGRRGGL